MAGIYEFKSVVKNRYKKCVLQSSIYYYVLENLLRQKKRKNIVYIKLLVYIN